MGTISNEIHIAAPVEQVWGLLADFGAAQDYNPGVRRSYAMSDANRGVGARRHCDIAGGMLRERVISWDEGKGYTVELDDSKGVPLREMRVRFRVAPNGDGTVFGQTMEYRAKGGLLSPVLDRMARRMLDKAQRGALAGLKQLAETGQKVDER